jgi:hypothetical protein
MKKIIFPVIAMLSLFSVVGCSTKFKVDAPYKNVTVVYSFLDEADTAHYVRIEKAFLDENKSAITMAQNPDSNYYKYLNVRVEKIAFLNAGNIVDTIHLNMVDLNLEGYPKDSGVFFNAPNYAYKFKTTLDPNYSYRLIITNPTSGEVDSAESPVIDDENSATFYVPYLDNIFSNLGGLDFSSTLPNATCEISANYTAPGNYNFYGQISPVAIAQAVLIFNWTDSNIANGSVSAHSYSFNAGYTTIINNNIVYAINDASLYSAVFSGMGNAPLNVVRLLHKCDLAIYLGTPDFYSYEQNALSLGVGLTANEIEPVYTNIKGASTVGIYTARAMRSGTISLNTATVDSLMVNSTTKNCNIIGSR